MILVIGYCTGDYGINDESVRILVPNEGARQNHRVWPRALVQNKSDRKVSHQQGNNGKQDAHQCSFGAIDCAAVYAAIILFEA